MTALSTLSAEWGVFPGSTSTASAAPTPSSFRAIPFGDSCTLESWAAPGPREIADGTAAWSSSPGPPARQVDHPGRHDRPHQPQPPCHIVTIEDPIEFLHRTRRAIVNQREVGIDTAELPRALKRALRQDPDVILVGEMRDIETIAIALTAAETGHLVLSTLHTPDATRPSSASSPPSRPTSKTGAIPARGEPQIGHFVSDSSPPTKARARGRARGLACHRSSSRVGRGTKTRPKR